MKRLILALLLIPMLSYTQEKFTGIGIFKLGIDTSLVYDYAKSVNQKVIGIDDDLEVYKMKLQNDRNELLRKDSESTVFKLIRGKRTYTLSRCTEVVEFFINQYSISGVKLYNVHLEFFRNKLVSLKCNNSQPLKEAMTVKYGPAEFRKTSKKISCVYKLTGITEEKDEDIFFETWSNSLIKANAVTSIYYDDKCEKQRLSYFTYNIENKELDKCKADGLNIETKPKVSRDQLKEF